MQAFGRALAWYDVPTERHSGRVSSLAALMAAELDLDTRERIVAADAGLVHDLGKLGMPTEILSKPGPLTEAERAAMERHPVIGAEILLRISPDLSTVALGVRSHHERWDGLGYPDGTAGEQIPLFGRLVAVVDVYDALTHRRSYRKSVYSPSRARRYLADHAGTEFDPECVEAALPVLRAHASARSVYGLGAASGGLRAPAPVSRRRPDGRGARSPEKGIT